jgi:hypothetical protein
VLVQDSTQPWLLVLAYRDENYNMLSTFAFLTASPTRRAFFVASSKPTRLVCSITYTEQSAHTRTFTVSADVPSG